MSHSSKCNRRFQGLPSRRSPSLPIKYGPHRTQLLFFVFDWFGGNFQLSSYWKKVNVLVGFFLFLFCMMTLYHSCSNVTILTPINLIYRQLVKISKDRGHPFGPLYDFRTSSDPLGPRGLKSQFWMRWKLGDHLRVHVCLSKRLILADCQGEGSEFLLHLFGESITKRLNDCRPFYLGVFIALFQFMFFFKLSF